MGEEGDPNGVTKLEAALAALVPMVLVAVTVNIYPVPLVKPDTVILPLPDCVTVPVKPPGLEVAVRGYCSASIT